MSPKATIALVILFGLFVLGKNTIFVVNEGQQAIITQFGKPVGTTITTAGLNFKTPFTQDVRFVDKRMLSWDGFPNQIPTRDKKFIKVDTTARYIIVDALKFIQTVRDQRGAKSRLDTILDSATRNVISSQNLVEAVRNSNLILDKIKETKKVIAEKKEKGEAIIEEGVSGEIAIITSGREKLSQMIASRADKELEAFGIKLIDVQLRRISYEKSVESKVYERMISERQRIALKIRSIGQGERAKIEGRLTRDLQEIKSLAYRKAQEIKGNGEAKATAIYAKALSQDPKFYAFMRSMDAYKKSLKAKTHFLLSSESEFLKYLKND